jgi:Catalytic LigB subunit of aromatic ring-opening dioxygenase
MASIVAAAASSHAFALTEPEDWDRGRAANRAGYARRWGQEPPEHPQLSAETLESNRQRYDSIRRGLSRVRESIQAAAPDVVVLFGDDQHEHFTDVVPQLAIYTGDHLKMNQRGRQEAIIDVECPSQLARHVLTACVDSGFDVTEIKHLPDDEMSSHALAQIVHFYKFGVPVLPVWVNGIVPPSPGPARCHAFGGMVRAGIESFGGSGRVLAYGSGGLSHFTAGYPYSAMEKREEYGSIHEDFDRKLVDAIRQGRGDELTALTSKDFLEHGEIETRQWVVIMGLTHDAEPDFVEYEPFYRGIMGMGVAYWSKAG